MTRTEARYAAQKLLKAGFHSPTICEDIEHGEIHVTAANRCWNTRTVASLIQLAELLDSEGATVNGRPIRVKMAV